MFCLIISFFLFLLWGTRSELNLSDAAFWLWFSLLFQFSTGRFRFVVDRPASIWTPVRRISSRIGRTVDVAQCFWNIQSAKFPTWFQSPGFRWMRSFFRASFSLLLTLTDSVECGGFWRVALFVKPVPLSVSLNLIGQGLLLGSSPNAWPNEELHH